MKYKRRLVSGMLALSLLTTGTTAYASEPEVRPSKVSSHLCQVKMKSNDTGMREFKSVDGKRIKVKDVNKTKKIKKHERINKLKNVTS